MAGPRRRVGSGFAGVSAGKPPFVSVGGHLKSGLAGLPGIVDEPTIAKAGSFAEISVEPGAGGALAEKQFRRAFGENLLREIDPGYESAPLNYINIPSGVLTQMPDWGRPVCLIPCTVSGAFVHYSPVQVKADSAGVPSANSLLLMQRSILYGLIYLPTPGKWWFYQSSNNPIQYIVIDASDPNVLGRYLVEDGVQTQIVTKVTAPSTVSVTDITVVNAQIARRSIIIHNQSTTASQNAWIAPGAATGAPVVSADGYLTLAPADFLRFDGPFAIKGALRATSSGAFTVPLSVWELF